MHPTFAHRAKSFVLALLATISLLWAQPLHAHSRGMGALTIYDQGTQLIVTWCFFYDELPAQLVLPGHPPETLSLQDSQTLDHDLRKLAQHAFTLSLDHQVVEPLKIPKVTTLPDKTCIVTFVYPGRPNGYLELQAPVLQYFPPAYLLNVRIVNYTGTMASGFLGEHWPDNLTYVQGANSGTNPASSWADPAIMNAFKMQLRTAWINTNWLLLCLVLLFTQRAKRIILLLSVPLFCWLSFCFLWVVHAIIFPWRIPELALCIPFIFLCWRAAKHPHEVVWLTLGAWATGILNAAYDIQHITLEDFGQTIPVFAEYGSGFVVSLATVFLVLTPVVMECKKFPGIQVNWTPNICWLAAALSMLLPLGNLIFH